MTLGLQRNGGEKTNKKKKTRRDFPEEKPIKATRRKNSIAGLLTMTSQAASARVTSGIHRAVPDKRRNVNICRARRACVSVIHQLVMTGCPYRCTLTLITLVSSATADPLRGAGGKKTKTLVLKKNLGVKSLQCIRKNTSYLTLKYT